MRIKLAKKKISKNLLLSNLRNLLALLTISLIIKIRSIADAQKKKLIQVAKSLKRMLVNFMVKIDIQKRKYYEFKIFL